MMNAITLGFVMVNVLRIRSIYNGKRFRALTVLDMFSRESLAIYVYKLSKSEQVCKEMEILEAARGLPRRIKVDKGPEFISRALDALAYFNRVKFDYFRPGTPTNNPHIESFNGSFRDECLNMNWFMSLEDARDKVERWRRDYNEFRQFSANIPHAGLIGPKIGL